MKVLVTDAAYKHAVAAIRSLGRRGVEVVAAASSKSAQGLYSRFTRERLILPPSSDTEAFATALAEASETRGIQAVLPIGYWSTLALSRHRARLPSSLHIAVAEWPAMEVASDKSRTLEFADRQGVSIPRTYPSAREVDRFPVVAKGRFDSGRVRYVRTREELDRIDTTDAILQEYVQGDGYGLYALLDRGVEKAVFMHKRLREYPVTGGASTMAESFHDPKLAEAGLTLLRALRWHGVAMVEFKQDVRDGSYRLMEINPKFWGSLDLAIASGVDFPWLTVQLALETPLGPGMPDYPDGVRFRWVFDDLMHAIARPTDSVAFVRDFFDPEVQSDLTLEDWKPGVISALHAARSVISRARRGTLRRPHGDPQA
jgi:predicted ATP-grasp superfamily ATP-dependent carboligase